MKEEDAEDSVRWRLPSLSLVQLKVFFFVLFFFESLLTRFKTDDPC